LGVRSTHNAVPLEFDVLRSGNKIGVELEMIDEAPGIADLSKVLAGGYSTANSLGLGLSGTKRLVDEFNVATELGKGTRILIRKWKKEF
jgi:serine/threonine-protein kinase RsbT